VTGAKRKRGRKARSPVPCVVSAESDEATESGTAAGPTGARRWRRRRREGGVAEGEGGGG